MSPPPSIENYKKSLTFLASLPGFFISPQPVPTQQNPGHIAMVTRRLLEFNMAASSKSSVSRYPTEKAVKDALDVLKPPGILSKVSFSNLAFVENDD